MILIIWIQVVINMMKVYKVTSIGFNFETCASDALHGIVESSSIYRGNHDLFSRDLFLKEPENIALYNFMQL